MKNKRNCEPHRTKYQKLYTQYLEEAANHGWFSEKEVKYWSNINKKNRKEGKAFRFCYSQSFRTGLRRNII